MALFGTSAFAITDSLMYQSDVRVTDSYSGLVFGTLDSGLFSYSGNDSGISFSGVLDIVTSKSFNIFTREDVIDALASQIGDANARLTLSISVEKCENFGIGIKDKKGALIKLYNGALSSGDNKIEVYIINSHAVLSINSKAIGSCACEGLPIIYISGSSVDMAVTDAELGIVPDISPVPDRDRYSVLWTEDFEDEIDTSVWSVIGELRSGAVGSTDVPGINIMRKYIDVYGEQGSTAFFGASLLSGASRNEIKRSISVENCVVTAYFYDEMNAAVPLFYIRANNNTGVGCSNDNEYYTYRKDGVYTVSVIPRSRNWHSVVFDGLSEPGKVSVVLDGFELFTTEDKIEFLSLGNSWTNNSYSVFWADNISVMIEKNTEGIRFFRNGHEVSTIPNSGSVTLSADNPIYDAKYYVAAYSSGKLKSIIISDAKQIGTGVEISYEQADKIKVFRWYNKGMVPLETVYERNN